jgi:hypothetical protein
MPKIWSAKSVRIVAGMLPAVEVAADLIGLP